MKSLSHHIPGFTLIEIIVVITLLAIFTMTATSVDFSRLSVRQEHEIFTNKVITNIETLKNFAFQGKGIGVNLATPEQWTMDISLSSSGTLSAAYSGTESGNSSYDSLSFVANSGYHISDVTCKTFDNSLPDDIITTPITLTFIGDKISMTGCSSTRYTILQLTTNHGGYSDIIEINTVNSVIQKR